MYVLYKNSHVTPCSTLEWSGNLLKYSELWVEEETRQEGKRDWKLRSQREENPKRKDMCDRWQQQKTQRVSD